MIDLLSADTKWHGITFHGAIKTIDFSVPSWFSVWPDLVAASSYAVWFETAGRQGLLELLATIEAERVVAAIGATLSIQKRRWLQRTGKLVGREIIIVDRAIAVEEREAILVHNGGVTKIRNHVAHGVRLVRENSRFPFDPAIGERAWDELLSGKATLDLTNIALASEPAFVVVEDSTLARQMAKELGLKSSRLESSLGHALADSIASALGGGDGILLVPSSSRQLAVSINDGQPQLVCEINDALPIVSLVGFFPSENIVRNHKVQLLTRVGGESWEPCRRYQLISRSMDPIELEVAIDVGESPSIAAFDMMRHRHIELIAVED